MNRVLRVTPLLATLAVAAAALVPSAVQAQYFGRNKVQYETFDWRIMRTDNLDMYFYPAESLSTADMARAGQRWYSRLSDLFRHSFDRKSVIMYADHADFQQTNVIGGELSEGTGGVTEGLRTRVVMPHTGSYKDDDHVLGHELVHVFQYNVAEQGPGGLNRLSALPLWLIEGMAEYLSLGRVDALTAMWLRDAALRDRLPTIKQLNTDPRFFPYRYGQALWAYVGGRWGDRAVIDVYRSSLRLGWDQALIRVLGVSNDSLSKDWIASTKAQYLPLLEGRTKPKESGALLLPISAKTGDYNLAPTVSPDGRFLAFYSRRGLFDIDVYVADAATGKVIKKLGAATSGAHIDAISFIQSSGTWSPDAQRFAYIVFAEGNNEIAIYNVRSGDVERQIEIPGVGAVLNLTWSPDGRTLAFSGMHGGVSDLFVMDVASGTVRALTNDRFSDIQPTWSPDGTTLAFSSDRGEGTDFRALTYSPMQLALIEVASGRVRTLPVFPSAKHINPQFSPDGRDLFFISDWDGFPDIYRVGIQSGAVARITRLATGVSGITSLSPAISVARATGRLYFSVFDDQGYPVFVLDPNQLVGTPVTPGPASITASVLPPGDPPAGSPITAYLHDPFTGLPPTGAFEIRPYKPSFALDAIGQPSLGVASGPFGTGVAGGVSAYFGDQLGDQMIGTAIQAQGTVQDIGGQVFYLNQRKRVNWGAELSHIPYLTGYTGFRDAGGGFVEYDQYLQRIFYSSASGIAQYPFSSTRRVEGQLSASRIGFSSQVDRIIVDPAGNIVDRRLEDDTTHYPAVYYAQAQLALVGDNSFMAYTSPVQGQRYRYEVSPTFGTLQFTSALADYRKYFFMRPFSLAFRGMHYGRYGKDSEDYTRLSPLYLGEEPLIRGYGYGSFDVSECTGGASSSSCPVFDRLVGSRFAVFNTEFRIPLVGSREFGLLNIPFLPIEVSPFFDGGVMWTSDQSPKLKWTQDGGTQLANCGAQTTQFINCVERVPVFSTGVSIRVNVLGYMILETYFAHPFQRPTKNWVWGIQMVPGW